MDFSFSEDQRELRAIVAAFLERHATSQQVRAAAEADGFAAEQWARLTGEMELTGLAVAPELGGAGASFVEVGIAIEEIGRRLCSHTYRGTRRRARCWSGSPAARPRRSGSTTTVRSI